MVMDAFQKRRKKTHVFQQKDMKGSKVVISVTCLSFLCCFFAENFHAHPTSPNSKLDPSALKRSTLLPDHFPVVSAWSSRSSTSKFVPERTWRARGECSFLLLEQLLLPALAATQVQHNNLSFLDERNPIWSAFSMEMCQKNEVIFDTQTSLHHEQTTCEEL